MDIPLIILISLVAGLQGSMDIKHKTFNFKTFFKTFFSVGIFVSIIALIMDRVLPKKQVSSSIFGGIILVLGFYLTILVFIQVKKK